MVSTKPIEYTNPLGSYQSTFEIGAPNGILLTVDVTATPFISFTDKSGSYSVLRGADPVIDDDLATKRYADSLIATPQYWDRDLINNHVFPLTVGDSVVVDPATFLAPAIPFGVPFLDTAVIHHGGDIRVNVENAFADATVMITNGAAGFAHLSLPGMVVADCVRGYAAADQLYFLCLDTGGVLSGDGLLLDGTTTPILTFTPQNAITTFDFQAIVSTLNLYVSDILNLNPSVAGASNLGDLIIDIATGTLAYSDGLGGWLYPLTGPAGLDTEIQFNDGGVLGTDALFVFDKTNNHLGIGTATPGVEIQVETGANLGAIVLTNNNCAAGFGIGITPGGAAAITQAAAHEFAIFVNAHQSITILSTGKIGVGLGATAATPTRDFYIDSADGMHLHPCALPAGAIGDICLDVADSLLKYHNGAGWVTPGVTIGGSDTYLQYNNGGNLGGTANLVWKHTTSKLGINVPLGNPQNDLHIDGVTGAAIIQLSNDITGRALTNGLQLSLSPTGHGALYNHANKDLAFGTNGAAVITLKNDGKIGFGIAAPATNYHFDVGTGNSGGIQITNNATSGITSTDGFHIGILGTAVPASAGYATIFNAENKPIMFIFDGTSPVEKVRIREDGCVWISDEISSITPGARLARLQLDDKDGVPVKLQFSNSATGRTTHDDGFVVGIDATGNAILENQFATGDMSFYTSSTFRVKILSTGEMGVNVATPVSLLDVNGSFGCGYVETAVDLPIAATDPYYTIVVTADGKTVTLPPAADVPRRIFIIKAMIAGAGPTSVTVEADDAEIFDKIAGLLNLTLVGTTAGAAVQNETVTVQSNSVGWTVISRTVDCHPGL